MFYMCTVNQPSLSEQPDLLGNGQLFEELSGEPAPMEAPESVEPETPKVALEDLKLRLIDRQQVRLATIDVEELIPATHKARAIWELTGMLDLKGFYEGLRTAEGSKGRAAWDPRLLVSIWVYALSEGITSAREIERMMAYEPALLWLSGMQEINHHTLSDFRAEKQEALDDLFSQLLLLLEQQGLVKLERVMHDGTKIEAFAGSDSFRREKTVRRQLEQIKAVVAELESRPDGEQSKARQAARERAAREQKERLQQALAELTEEIQKGNKTPEEEQKARVSLTDPEARIMKHGDQAFGPAYNLQITTDAEQKVIVAVALNQCSSDAPALDSAIQQVEERMGRAPGQVVVDGGYSSQDNIIGMSEQGVDLIGPLGDQDKRKQNALKSSGIAPGFEPEKFVQIDGTSSLQCPAGKVLTYVRQSQKKHNRYHQYQAKTEDCTSCPFQPQCCPRSAGKGRTVSLLVHEPEAVVKFREKMEQEGPRQIYKQRGAVAEFPNAWIKEKIGLRKFRLRGLVKSATEALWSCLTYNIMIWKRLVWCGAAITA